MPGRRGRAPGVVLFRCTLCEEPFLREEELSAHEEVCDAEPVVQCPICRGFYDATNKLTHDRSDEHVAAARHYRATGPERRAALLNPKDEVMEEADAEEADADAELDDDDVGFAVVSTAEVEPPAFAAASQSSFVSSGLSTMELAAAATETDVDTTLPMPRAPPPWYAPYKSGPEALLRYWQVDVGRPDSDNKFDDLLHLLTYVCEEYVKDPDSLPRNLAAITSSEMVEVEERLTEVELPSGGSIFLEDVNAVLHDEFEDPDIHDRLTGHFDASSTPSDGELWFGDQWQQQQAGISRECVYFPHLVFSNETAKFKSRKGKNLHDILWVPAGLPRELRQSSAYKRIVAFVTEDANVNEAIKVFAEAVHSAEMGRELQRPDGTSCVVMFRVLLWLADHVEANKLAAIHQLACRRCFEEFDSDRNCWRARSVQDTEEFIAWARDPARSLAELVDAERKRHQHIVYPSLLYLADFNPYRQLIMAPWHSFFLGRLHYLVLWLILDLPETDVNRLDRAAASVPSFPGVISQLSMEPKRRLSYLIKKKQLSGDEMQGLACRLPFIFLGLVSDERQDLIVAFCEIAPTYSQHVFTAEQRDYRAFLGEQVAMPSMKRLFQHRSQFKAAAFPKMHDPVHEPEIINAVESLANINEMNIGEKENKVLHEEVTRTPGRNVEPTLLQRMSRKSQLARHQPGLHEHYMEIVHPGAGAIVGTVLRGASSVTDWTNPAVQYKLEALRTHLTDVPPEEVNDLASQLLARPTLHLAAYQHELHASAVHRHKEAFSGVLLIEAAFDRLGILPWARLAELVELPSEHALALIETFDWYSPDEKIDPRTGTPWLKTTDVFCVVELSDIRQEVLFWPDKRQKTAIVYWIDWWVATGEARYPDHHRWQVQRQLRWRDRSDASRQEHTLVGLP
eukprot:TRINITY_DN612_c0_g3_i2.p1 TRINITY_DN612_c0_g3~~TRINITY_DN612_c0_g3_i2.p1  ORF type:complete len:909 (+),score=182.70 TRINITY_DN612_c0_g3_i2:173-2899(+)